MPPLHLVATQSCWGLPDAARPQGSALVRISCQSGHLSAIVDVGRTQAVWTTGRGSACRTTPQENRSRGCRAPKSFCRFAWLPLWQLAQQKKKKSSMLTSLLRSNQPTPANTSKSQGRAMWADLARPALFLSAARPPVGSANIHNPATRPFEIRRVAHYAGGSVTQFNRRFPCGPLPLSQCLPLQRSPRAQSPRLSPSQCLLPSSLLRPANTAPEPSTERARRVDRHAPVSTCRAPQQEVRPC
jgi:hypothetical protein